MSTHKFQGLRRWAIAVAAISALFGASAASATTAVPIGRTARTTTVSDTGRLHLVSKSGSSFSERGTATGTLPGAVNAHFVLRVTEATGTVTINARGGSLTLALDAFAQSAGSVARLNGTMTVTHGTGKYAHAHGTESLTATVNRRSWAIKAQMHGRLSY